MWDVRRPMRPAVRLGAIFIIAGAALWAGYTVWDEFPRSDRLASVDTLVEQFDRVVYWRVTRNSPMKRIAKWARPVRIRLSGEKAEHWRPIVDKHVATLTQLTGVRYLIDSAPPDSDNLFIYFHENGSADKFVYRHFDKPGTYADSARKSGCMFMFSLAWPFSRITKGLVTISLHKLYESSVPGCILTGLATTLGIDNESALIRPSIFTGRTAESKSLSINDRVIIRALYDPRLRLGMPRGEALKVARGVIAELHAKVRAGEPITLAAD